MIKINFKFENLPYAIFHRKLGIHNQIKFHRKLGIHNQMLKTLQELTELSNELHHIVVRENPLYVVDMNLINDNLRKELIDCSLMINQMLFSFGFISEMFLRNYNFKLKELIKKANRLL